MAAAILSPTTSAVACNPDAPLPPVLEDHAYDDLARKVLMTQAGTIAMARLLTRVDLVFESDGPVARAEMPVYQFDVKDGWKAPGPRRLSLDGHWVSCDLDLKPGAWFLIFLQGDWPLYIRPADDASVDLQILGEIQWFYTRSGELVLPELVEDVPQSPRETIEVTVDEMPDGSLDGSPDGSVDETVDESVDVTGETIDEPGREPASRTE
ncbi:MAG: hypothetical protein WBN31_11620 [Gammaproteobacteria bacterium]